MAHRIGRRGATLLFLGLLDLLVALNLATPTAIQLRTPTYAYLQQIMPIQAWASIWAAVGLICLAGMFAPPDGQGFARTDAPAFTAAVAIKIMWGILTAAMWLDGRLPHGYQASGIWLAFGGLIAVWAGVAEPRLLDVRTGLTQEVRQALIALGWTPPAPGEGQESTGDGNGE